MRVFRLDAQLHSLWGKLNCLRQLVTPSSALNTWLFWISARIPNMYLCSRMSCRISSRGWPALQNVQNKCTTVRSDSKQCARHLLCVCTRLHKASVVKQVQVPHRRVIASTVDRVCSQCADVYTCVQKQVYYNTNWLQWGVVASTTVRSDSKQCGVQLLCNSRDSTQCANAQEYNCEEW